MSPIGPNLESILTKLFSELVHGAPDRYAFMLNRGDAGMLASLDALTADDASRSVNGGATIAAHAEHVRYGLSLMNRWIREGGNPFANARWDDAWKTASVDAGRWEEIRTGLRDESANWLNALGTRRATSDLEPTGMISSIAHLAYHLGAIRQIDRGARGPREG